MQHRDQQAPVWNAMHDLALIYLACAYSDDEAMEYAHGEAVRQALRVRHPEAAPAAVQQAVHTALLMYAGPAAPHMLDVSVASLRETLTPEERLNVLSDLTDRAITDGAVHPGELSFIEHLAHQWDLGQEALW